MDWDCIFERTWELFQIFLCYIGAFIFAGCSVACIVFAIIGAIKLSLMWLLLLIAVPVFLFLTGFCIEIAEWI